jgi:hypothetical protein
MMRSTARKAARCRLVLRVLCTWLAIAALISSSAYAVNAHLHEANSLATFELIQPAPGGSDAGAAGEHACHCMCHFCGLAAASCADDPERKQACSARAAGPSVSVRPGAPLRPPKI